ncbi:MAG: ubiquinone/menaquinone biosynthesis methyltransferase [bacterium]
MEKKGQIQRLFSGLSPNYDLFDTLFSLGVDRFWREMAAARMPGQGPFLDLCAGTLELSLALLGQEARKGWVAAVDFCPDMLLQGRRKLGAGRPLRERIAILAGDGEHIPLKGECFQGAMIGFGLRNLTDREAGLRELWRVLKPGGRLVVLEFSDPVSPLFRQLYYCYFCHILTPLGNLFSGRLMPFNHLRDSVLAFPRKDDLAAMMEEAGFIRVRYQLLTYGIAAIHWGDKPSE